MSRSGAARSRAESGISKEQTAAAIVAMLVGQWDRGDPPTIRRGLAGALR